MKNLSACLRSRIRERSFADAQDDTVLRNSCRNNIGLFDFYYHIEIKLKNMRLIITIILWLISFLLINSQVEAAKKFVAKGSASTRTARSGGGSIPVSVRYRPDKRAIHFSFTNFTNINSASYVFSYQTNGMTQGAAGSITAANSPGEVRELLFGTCSTSVCTYHTGLKGAKLTITAVMKNGNKIGKNFRIKTYF